MLPVENRFPADTLPVAENEVDVKELLATMSFAVIVCAAVILLMLATSYGKSTRRMSVDLVTVARPPDLPELFDPLIPTANVVLVT